MNMLKECRFTYDVNNNVFSGKVSNPEEMVHIERYGLYGEIQGIIHENKLSRRLFGLDKW